MKTFLAILLIVCANLHTSVQLPAEKDGFSMDQWAMSLEYIQPDKR